MPAGALGRLVLLIIGATFLKMTPVLWVIARLSTIPVIHRGGYIRCELRAGRGLPDPKLPQPA